MTDYIMNDGFIEKEIKEEVEKSKITLKKDYTLLDNYKINSNLIIIMNFLINLPMIQFLFFLKII